MTIGGAISELINLLKADDIPIYYKPSIKKVIETLEQDAISKDATLKLFATHDGKYLYEAIKTQ